MIARPEEHGNAASPARRASVVATHDLALLALADRVLQIHDGVLAGELVAAS